MKRRIAVALFAGTMLLLLTVPQAKADDPIQVADCEEHTTCWTSGTPTAWSDSLSLADLTAVGLTTEGNAVSLQALQDWGFTIRLGETKLTLFDGTSTTTQTLGEFNGSGSYADSYDAYWEIDTVGRFLGDGDAISGTISGTFGNSSVSNSSGVCVALGNGDATGTCAEGVPEPNSFALMGIGLGSMLLALAFGKRKQLTRSL